MSLTPEQIAKGWKLHDGSDVCPIKDERTRHQVMIPNGVTSNTVARASEWMWQRVIAYRLIDAHGADAEPARPTPYPNGYDDLVFDDAGWSQTIIVDGKRPEWLRDDDRCSHATETAEGWRASRWEGEELAIRVRRREPKRETVQCIIHHRASEPLFGLIATMDLIDGKPDLSTLKIAEEAL